MSSNHSSPETDSDWSLSLDLLIARAALDQSLRSELLENPHDCCKANGVLIPGDVHLVISNADQETIIREIPIVKSDASFQKTIKGKAVLGPAVFNEAVAEAEVGVAAAAVEVEAEVNNTTTTAEAEAEAVVVIVAT